ncbi:hypothetical protein TRIUR3_23408 [Triticum urartu]|uniref:Uncharacterized protein n=1 Tax=Triticum urartu TaxID=4572 RepID=M7ZH33_TRIUA|nr:hypothetical protein TRIUR3_23408 [Triticum urartu]
MDMSACMIAIWRHTLMVEMMVSMMALTRQGLLGPAPSAAAASTTTTGTPAVSSSRLAGSPPAENPAADQGSELEPRPEPLDRDWGSTLSRADLTEVAGILRRLRDEQISLGLGTFNLLLKRACEADDFLLFAKAEVQGKKGQEQQQAMLVNH